MKAILVTAAMLLLAGTVRAQTNATLTAGGVTYTNAMLVRVNAYAATYKHSTGIASIPLAQLPPDIQSRLAYDPSKAAAQRNLDIIASQKVQREATAQAANAAAQADSVRQETASQIDEAHAKLNQTPAAPMTGAEAYGIAQHITANNQAEARRKRQDDLADRAAGKYLDTGN